jgi:hypothetical protein
MIDAFILLTPILVFAILALSAFVGCDRLLGLQEVYPPPDVLPVTRIFQQAANQNSGKGPFTVSFSPLASDANLIVLVSIHWGNSGGATAAITVNGAAPQAIESDLFNPQAVAHVFASGLSGPISVSIALSSNSNTAWDYCVSIYSNADQSSSPFNSPVSRQGTAQGAIPDSANQISITSSSNNLIYAVANSQVAGGVLGGNLAVGAGFSLVASPSSYFLVEDLAVDDQTTEPVIPAVSASGGARWYFFAAEIKHA